MKKFFYLAIALCMGFAMTSCDDDDEFVTLVVQQDFQMTADQLTAIVGEEYVLAPEMEGNDAGTTYKWEIDGKVVGEEPVLRYTFEKAGEYEVFLTATNSYKSGVGYTYHVTVKPKTLTVDFEGDYWTALIPQGQAYGVATLIYGDAALTYAWQDEKTHLQGGLTLAWGGGYGFAEGGTVVSNYIDDNIIEHASSDYQLAVPVSNGSANFAVVYCGATIRFPEGERHVIESLDIAPTTYLLGEMKNGGYGKALTENGDYLTVTFTADNGKTLNVDLARDGAIKEGWETVDFSSLGEVNSLTFSMDGNDRSSYGVKHPQYFAFDNVVVEMK